MPLLDLLKNSDQGVRTLPEKGGGAKPTICLKKRNCHIFI
tara:strand:- start:19 stop:138 length:120 start_codon:yes stop_codon:yes gene_type:complete